MVSRRVEDCLSNKDTAPCLSWCYENKSKLRKLKVEQCLLFFVSEGFIVLFYRVR